MFTWSSTSVVFGFNRRTGEIVIFLVGFDAKGHLNYTPLAGSIAPFGVPAAA